MNKQANLIQQRQEGKKSISILIRIRRYSTLKQRCHPLFAIRIVMIWKIIHWIRNGYNAEMNINSARNRDDLKIYASYKDQQGI